MCFESICYIRCTTAFTWHLNLQEEMSSQRTPCLRLFYTGVLSIHPVLYWALTLVYLTQTGVQGEGKGKKGMKAGVTDDQGRQICWTMDYRSPKVEAGMNLSFCQDGRNNYYSLSHSQQ